MHLIQIILIKSKNWFKTMKKLLFILGLMVSVIACDNKTISPSNMKDSTTVDSVITDSIDSLLIDTINVD